MEQLKLIWGDLRHLNPFPKRYKNPKGDARYWSNVMRRYSNLEKEILSTDYSWYLITFDDGRKELAHLRVLSKGLFTGLYPAIYRGIFIPHRMAYGTFAHIKDIRLAF